MQASLESEGIWIRMQNIPTKWKRDATYHYRGIGDKQQIKHEQLNRATHSLAAAMMEIVVIAPMHHDAIVQVLKYCWKYMLHVFLAARYIPLMQPLSVLATVFWTTPEIAK